MVLALDTATGITGYFAVTAVLSHEDPSILHLTIDGERLETTPEHPFYTENGWMPAGELTVGTRIRRADGSWGIVQGSELVAQAQTMLNLTVSTAHTFFVGNQQWLVHNTCSIGSGRPGNNYAQEGIYEFRSSNGQTYVGQSGNIPQRIQQHITAGRLLPGDMATVRTTAVAGGRTARVIAEQLRINQLGGVSVLRNIRNAISPARWPLFGIH
jgi:hypothetical protein